MALAWPVILCPGMLKMRLSMSRFIPQPGRLNCQKAALDFEVKLDVAVRSPSQKPDINSRWRL